MITICRLLFLLLLTVPFLKAQQQPSQQEVSTCTNFSSLFRDASPISSGASLVRVRKDGSILDVMSCGKLHFGPAYVFPSVLRLRCRDSHIVDASFEYQLPPFFHMTSY